MQAMTKREQVNLDRRKERAKALRFKKPISAGLNYWDMMSELRDMAETCNLIHWWDDDEDGLVSALDGDEDWAEGFKMEFALLESEIEQFQEDFDNAHEYDECGIGEWFDLVFPACRCGGDGYLGYDEMAGDYYGLESYEYGFAENAAAEKLMRLTKKEIIDVVAQSLAIFRAYMGIKYRYELNKAAIDTLKGENLDVLKAVKAVEEQYEVAERESNGFRQTWSDEVTRYERLLREIPREQWLW